MKPKLLCILHRSPPAHGAAKVGDFIGQSKKLREKYECKFITIKSSEVIGDIGKINFRKLYFAVKLYVRILNALIIFRPDKIYYTASIGGVAFYRDIFVSTLWKLYAKFTKMDLFYHYHTKGIDNFVSKSNKNLSLMNFFIKHANIILLSPLLEKDMQKINSYKKIFFLPNGVEDMMVQKDFKKYLEIKYTELKEIKVLYMAHMMKDKGYCEVLELARNNKMVKNIYYHFAGSWRDETDKKYFFDFVEKYQLEKQVVYHGFVSAEKKRKLFETTHILIYPSKNDAFPLSILEALSYGVPIVSTNEGSIPYMVNANSGIVIDNLQDLSKAFNEALGKFINIETASYCRQRYLKNFSLEKFEEHLVEIFI